MNQEVQRNKSKLSRMSQDTCGSPWWKWDRELGKAITSDKWVGNLWKLVLLLSVFGRIVSSICKKSLFWLISQPCILFISLNTIIQTWKQKRKVVHSYSVPRFACIPKSLFCVEKHGNTSDSEIYLCCGYTFFVIYSILWLYILTQLVYISYPSETGNYFD